MLGIKLFKKIFANGSVATPVTVVSVRLNLYLILFNNSIKDSGTQIYYNLMRNPTYGSEVYQQPYFGTLKSYKLSIGSILFAYLESELGFLCF